MKKLKFPKITHTFVQYILIFLLAGSVIFMSSFVYWLWRNQMNDLSQVRGSIVQAVSNMYKPIVIEPKEKQQYIHEASVRMPLQADLPTFEYHYNAADESQDISEDIMLTTRAALNAGIQNLGFDKTLFDRVPDLQQCPKLFLIIFQPELPDFYQDFEQTTSKPLADGRTAYIFKKKPCPNPYIEDMLKHDRDALQSLVEQIEAY